MIQIEKNTKLLARLNEVKTFKGFKNDFELAKALKTSSSYIYEIMLGTKAVPKTMGQKLEDNLGVSRQWFETGEGYMFPLHTNEGLSLYMKQISEGNSGTNLLREPEVTYQRTPKGVGVPVYYDAISTGLFANNELKPVAWLNTAEFANCEAVIQVKDDSMAGTMNERDWVGIKQVKNWQQFLPMNYMYALVTDDFELIRIIRKGSNDDKLSLVSPGNEHYTNEIDKSLIREVWSVRVILPYSKIETLL